MSFLKQLLTPFVEFDADKKEELAKQNKSPKAPAAATPASADEDAQHPLITGANSSVIAANQTPVYSPGGTIAGPLPEHEQYFERLIDEANAKNPLFQGADFKEFVDSKVDIDDITDEALKYRTAYNFLKSTGLTKEKLMSTGQEYLNIIGRDLNAFQSAHAQQYKKEAGQTESVIQKSGGTASLNPKSKDAKSRDQSTNPGY